MTMLDDRDQDASRLRGSLLEFIQFFYKYITGREFIISCPPSRESHHKTICRAYSELFHVQKESHGLLINVPPGYGKSVMTCMWIAWCFTHYPDCNFLYISYSHDLASKHTAFIKQIMSSRLYKDMFNVEISQDTRAKDKFSTKQGGTVCAYGSTGSITGSNAGSPGLKRFSGCVVIDDAHKPEEIYSAATRESVIRNYQETILQRPRDINVPILFIGQRLHEDDLGAYLMSGKDVRKWQTIILKGIDLAGHPLFPEVQPLSYLLDLQEKQPFVFYSQIQQDPVPAGGSLFKPEWFVMLDKEPNFISTFIVADTAETSLSYNDASAFSFFGLYEIETMGRKTGEMGLHWIDCVELRIEPKDLKAAFIDFYANCSLHPKPPLMAAIEKKSTGVTLISVLSELRGMQIREIERTKASGSKTVRYLEMQPHIAARKFSFTEGAKHVDMCIKHMSKITANNSHKHDDICDNAYDGCRIALIEKTLYAGSKIDEDRKKIMDGMNRSLSAKVKLGVVRNAGQNPY
jgi:hypothetical protein